MCVPPSDSAVIVCGEAETFVYVTACAVLRTNTELPTSEVAKAYKSLWRVERAFRETKSTLDVRPVYHHRDDTMIGHIVGCFLALRLEVDLQRRLDANDVDVSWPDLMRDLEELKAIEVDLDGERYRLRTDLQGAAAAAFKAAGVRPPATLTHLGPVTPPAPAASAVPPHTAPSDPAPPRPTTETEVTVVPKVDVRLGTG
jgi:hypothetical protein